MERSEPTLVPEWLRSTGSVSGVGSSTHQFASSSSLSDVSSSTHHARNRNSKSVTDFDSHRFAFLDRTPSSNARRSSSNGSVKHAYSSFSRGHRDKDRERDKDRLSFGDHWDRNSSDPLGSILTGGFEKDVLRRSHSMVSRRQDDVLPRRVVADLKIGGSNHHTNRNGVISSGATSSIIQKAVFEKDFPSLGSEEKQGVPDIGRVSSPGLSTAVQSLPVGSSAVIGGEGWTSALADVPSIIGSSSMGSLSAAHTVAASPSGPPSAMAGLNMAEALTQAPSKTRTVPQLSVQTQRLEELAIKQSRQLIPVTPSMPKSSVLSSSDKSKPKTVVRPNEMNMTAKSMQQQQPSLHTGNQSLLVKSDALKTPHGKLFVLKPGWENGVALSSKDVPSPTNGVNRAANGQLAAPSVPSAPPKSPNNPKHSSGERKSASSNLVLGFNLEKRPTLLQTQSRNDFFNLLKKKTSVNSSPVIPDSATAVSSPTCENSCEVSEEVTNAPQSPQVIKNGTEMTINGVNHEEFQRFSEEETAFLRSLGWEENSGEDEFLTEEEINAFYQKCMKLNPLPPLKVCGGVQQKLIESHATRSGGVSSEVGSADSGSKI